MRASGRSWKPGAPRARSIEWSLAAAHGACRPARARAPQQLFLPLSPAAPSPDRAGVWCSFISARLVWPRATGWPTCQPGFERRHPACPLGGGPGLLTTSAPRASGDSHHPLPLFSQRRTGRRPPAAAPTAPTGCQRPDPQPHPQVAQMHRGCATARHGAAVASSRDCSPNRAEDGRASGRGAHAMPCRAVPYARPHPARGHGIATHGEAGSGKLQRRQQHQLYTSACG